MVFWSWTGYKDAVKRYFKFSKGEIRGLILTIVVLSIIAGLNDGSDSFSLGPWLANFAQVMLIVTIAVLVQQIGHRLAGIRVGLRAEYSVWWNGLIIGLLVAIVTRGNIWLLIPGGIMVHHMNVHRLGFFRYGLNIRAIGYIALLGPIANVLMAGIAKTISIWLGGIGPAAFFDDLFFFNMLYAGFNLIPIPPLAGSKVLFWSRIGYAFFVGAVGGYALLALLNIYSFVYAIIIGFIVYVIYFIYDEHKNVDPFQLPPK